MTVLDLFTLIRRGWKILLVAVVVGALAGAAYALTTPKVYQSTATGFIAATGDAVVNGSDEAIARAGAYTVLVNTSQVREVIAEQAGISVDDLYGSLSARVVAGAPMIAVTASSPDPESALQLANGALDALSKVVARVEKMAGNTGENATGIRILPMDSAVAPTAPSSPNIPLIVGVGAVAGLVLGLLIVVLRRALDVRVRAHTDIAALVGVGVLGRIPKVTDGKSKKEALTRTIADEAYRQIRTGLRFASVDTPVDVVMVTSANQGEGKSLAARSLARVMAESGRPTLIVDADLRRPTVAEGFGIDGTVGLSEVLSGQIDVISAIRTTNDRNLFVLPSGGIPPNPSEMLGSTAMHELIAQLRRDFFVILDAPPVLPVTDARVLASTVDGAVFVAAMGRTRVAEVTEARAQLEQVRARVLGVVLNMVALSAGENGYGYYRKNSNYYAHARQQTDAADEAAREAGDFDPVSAFTDVTPAPVAGERAVQEKPAPARQAPAAADPETPAKPRTRRRSTTT